MSMDISSHMTDTLICYSPELILTLDKEGKDYPIDAMVLAVLNGIKKAGPPHHPHQQHQGADGAGRGRGAGRSFGRNHYNNGPQGPNSGSYGSGSGRGYSSRPNHGSHQGPQGSQGSQGRQRPRNNNSNNHSHSSTNNANVDLGPRRKLYVEDGDAFLASIKNCLAKLSSENFASITTQLLNYELDKSDTIDEVAKLLHEAAINGVFIVDYYVAVFLALVKRYPKIIVPLNQRIIKQINEPFDFENEADTLTESRLQKAERWQLSNIMIFAELYRKGAYNEVLMRKTLKGLLEKVCPNQENQMPMKLITELLQKITKSYDIKRRDQDMNDLMKKLEAVARDKSYPGPVRFPLLNAVKEFDDRTLP